MKVFHFESIPLREEINFNFYVFMQLMYHMFRSEHCVNQSSISSQTNLLRHKYDLLKD